MKKSSQFLLIWIPYISLQAWRRGLLLPYRKNALCCQPLLHPKDHMFGCDLLLINKKWLHCACPWSIWRQWKPLWTCRRNHASSILRIYAQTFWFVVFAVNILLALPITIHNWVCRNLELALHAKHFHQIYNYQHYVPVRFPLGKKAQK